MVYKNRNALPFGYLLTNEISEKEFMDSGLVTRMELLTDSWFETGSTEAADAEANAEAEVIKKNKLLAEGRYTDAIDEIILNVMKAKIKKYKVKEI